MTSPEPIQEVAVACPYCGETVTIAVEADLDGELVQDCEVCCSPWQMRLHRAGGDLVVGATRLDD